MLKNNYRQAAVVSPREARLPQGARCAKTVGSELPAGRAGSVGCYPGLGSCWTQLDGSAHAAEVSRRMGIGFICIQKCCVRLLGRSL